jgi:hypothetical protein
MDQDIPRRLLAGTREYLAGFEETVLETFLGRGRAMEERTLTANPLPCLRHLDRIASMPAGQGSKIIRLLADNRDRFHWGQTYTKEDFGREFIENYGWMELVGTRGHFVSEEIAAGFLVLGPHLHYPDHHHAAEEIYIPLTGDTAWRKGDGPYAEHAAGSVIHHPSNVNHAMKTGPEPLLAFYLWCGGPLAARSIVTGKAEQD